MWEPEYELQEIEEEVNTVALDRLWATRLDVFGNKRDRLDRFCLNSFLGIGSQTGIETINDELGVRPHMAQLHCKYLARFAGDVQEVKQRLCSFIEADDCLYDWELQWPIAALLPLSDVPASTVNKVTQMLTNPARGQELRALSAVFAAKHGTAPTRTLIRAHWNVEQSKYVHTAMVLATLFFPSAERTVLLNHWGQQDPLFALVADAVRSS